MAGQALVSIVLESCCHAPELGVPGAASDRETVCEAPFSKPVTVAVRAVEIAPAIAENVVVVAPAASEMLAGTLSAVVLLESITVAPPLPAACDRVAVQVDDAPGLRRLGLQETELNAAGPTNCTDVACEPPFKEAVRLAV